MTVDFYSNKLRKQFADAGSLQKAFGKLALKIVERMEDIESSPSMAVLRQIGKANCHKLSGKRSHQWAVDLSGNYRLIFEFDHDPIPMKSATEIDFASVNRIRIVEIIDYH